MEALISVAALCSTLVERISCMLRRKVRWNTYGRCITKASKVSAIQSYSDKSVSISLRSPSRSCSAECNLHNKRSITASALSPGWRFAPLTYSWYAAIHSLARLFVRSISQVDRSRPSDAGVFPSDLSRWRSILNLKAPATNWRCD